MRYSLQNILIMKDKISARNLFLLLFLNLLSNLFAQKTELEESVLADFYKALELYDNKMYANAQQNFKKVESNATPFEEIKSEAAYYNVLCAIKLEQADAPEKVIRFVSKNPTSNRKNKVYLDVANYYFVHKKASHALKWYKKVNIDMLSTEKQNDAIYRMGYAMLSCKYLTEAKEKFKQILSDPTYGNDARYYYGYISYQQENYGEAEDNFSRLADDDTYKGNANYYLLDMSFKTGKFDKTIKIGKKILPTAKKEHISDIKKAIGESYFNLGKYKEAIPYLKEYKGVKGKWNNTDFYYLGYAYYKQNNYDNAIKYFTKIIGGNNQVAQNAYYHLGDCYLKKDKKPEALNAFKNAAEMHFSYDIQSDAAFNYAKLSYEEGNAYKSVTEVLENYLKKYPASKNKEEISELMITSFLHQRDYQGALEYLSKNQNKENNKLANEVSLYRGIQLFNEGKYREADPHFLIASDAENKTVRDKAKYWMAEADYRQEKYKNALQEFLSVEKSNVPEATDVNYHIGYTYFKLKEYNKAIEYFNKQLLKTTQSNNDLKDDINLRLGDSYFATRIYFKAIENYQKVIEEGGIGADYALYQTAKCYGLLGQNNNKIANLKTLINDYGNSNLNDDALFELAETYTKIKKLNKAHETYRNIIKNHPKSGYVPIVMLREGLLLYTNSKYNSAIAKFKEVVDKYPASNQAKQAISNAKKVYIDIGKVEEYADWVKGIKFINVTDYDIDNASYEAVENKFLENQIEVSINGFSSYISRFPNGNHLLKANYYLAEAYIKNNQPKKSIKYYNFVISQNRNEFSEDAMVKLSSIYLQNQELKKAISILKKLEQEATPEKNMIFAKKNLMKAYYLNKKYDEAINYAEKVLYIGKIEKQTEQNAKLTLARSYFKKSNYETAKEYFLEIEQTASEGKLIAESLYYKAIFLNNEKQYKASNEVIQKLIADYSSYKDWGVRGYVLMAKNQYKLNDPYQATYILENIIKNFSQYPDIIEEAGNELRTIETNESKINKSIQQKNTIPSR